MPFRSHEPDFRFSSLFFSKSVWWDTRTYSGHPLRALVHNLFLSNIPWIRPHVRFYSKVRAKIENLAHAVERAYNEVQILILRPCSREQFKAIDTVKMIYLSKSNMFVRWRDIFVMRPSRVHRADRCRPSFCTICDSYWINPPKVTAVLKSINFEKSRDKNLKSYCLVHVCTRRMACLRQLTGYQNHSTLANWRSISTSVQVGHLPNVNVCRSWFLSTPRIPAQWLTNSTQWQAWFESEQQLNQTPHRKKTKKSFKRIRL